MKTPIAFAVFLLACAGAMAQQQVWRCGSSYSQQPCADGKAVPTEDTRSPAQAAESRANTARDAKTANSMERERLALEGKAAPPVVLAPVAAAPAPASAPKSPPAKVKRVTKPVKKVKNPNAPAAAPVTLRPVPKAPAPAVPR